MSTPDEPNAIADLTKRIEALEKNSHAPVDVDERIRAVLLRMLMASTGKVSSTDEAKT